MSYVTKVYRFSPWPWPSPWPFSEPYKYVSNYLPSLETWEPLKLHQMVQNRPLCPLKNFVLKIPVKKLKLSP